MIIQHGVEQVNDKEEQRRHEDEVQRLSAQLIDIQMEKDQFKQRSEAAEARAHIIEQSLALSPSRPIVVTLGEASLSSESNLDGIFSLLFKNKEEERERKRLVSGFPPPSR